MAKVILTALAQEDIRAIAEYSLENWGLDQSRKYRKELVGHLDTLAAQPYLGQSVPEYMAGMRRFVFQSHSIFYLTTDKGILILRILGQSQDYDQHL